MSIQTPFHTGEQAVQTRMGVRDQIEPWARQVVRPSMPDQHRDFFTALPFMVVAARDQAGRPWVSLIGDEPGFATTTDAGTLSLAATTVDGDALQDGLTPGAAVGLLGIDLATRRRNRVNGRIRSIDNDTLQIAVDQSFGNCPQYIGVREWTVSDIQHTPRAQRHALSNPAIRAWVRNADTFFVASGYDGSAQTEHASDDPRFGMDASHRGGEPGFVHFIDDSTLVWPDFAGNNHYNTIGNLVMDPRVGLLFLDFEGGHLLQITGQATIEWGDDLAGQPASAGRRVVVAIDEIVVIRDALRLRWASTGNSVRSMRVFEKRRESNDVTSFLLAARDGGNLPDFEPGQHLTVEMPIAGSARRAGRTYSLSAAPGNALYRISVKRDPHGLVSRVLHDALEPGDFLDAQLPAGDFVLRDGSRPVVLISAGVGLTPMVSMLGALAGEPARREAWFIYGARNSDHHPLAAEVRDLVNGDPRLHLAVAYSNPAEGDVLGRDYDHHGRVQGGWLDTVLPTFDADYYLCGPPPFMAQVRADLETRGVNAGQIYYETFGPATSNTSPTTTVAAPR